jgi:enamine deaminase RidA (YjgF/YER057c/UK114 family)
MPVEYLNPSSMHQSPAFTQAIAASGNVKTVYIGLQLAQDVEGRVVGAGDVVAQTEQVLRNFDACLAAAGAGKEHVVRLGVFVTQGQDMVAAARAGMQWWGMTPNPPTNSVMFVAGFSPPEFLVGIEGIAVVPTDGA